MAPVCATDDCRIPFGKSSATFFPRVRAANQEVSSSTSAVRRRSRPDACGILDGADDFAVVHELQSLDLVAARVEEGRRFDLHAPRRRERESAADRGVVDAEAEERAVRDEGSARIERREPLRIGERRIDLRVEAVRARRKWTSSIGSRFRPSA
jgi:hypothetical protein